MKYSGAIYFSFRIVIITRYHMHIFWESGTGLDSAALCLFTYNTFRSRWSNCGHFLLKYFSYRIVCVIVNKNPIGTNKHEKLKTIRDYIMFEEKKHGARRKSTNHKEENRTHFFIVQL